MIFRRPSTVPRASHAMTAPSIIDPAHFLHGQLAQVSPNRLGTLIDTLMSAEADPVCRAGYGERNSKRTNIWNGFQPRESDTRARTLDIAIPELRSVCTVAHAYVPGHDGLAVSGGATCAKACLLRRPSEKDLGTG